MTERGALLGVVGMGRLDRGFGSAPVLITNDLTSLVCDVTSGDNPKDSQPS
jgi:hypothetical protein